jgi:trehalose/maltose hydrolase-like predicted phosphorylase
VKYGEAPLIGIPKPIASRFTWLQRSEVARNLLTYRYNQLDKAIEMLRKTLASRMGGPLSMVTMNGEECHNEWEITHEEIEMAPLLLQYSITTVSQRLLIYP